MEIALVLLVLGLTAGAIAGGAIGYALLFSCPPRWRTIASFVAACVPAFAWAMFNGSERDVAMAAQFAFASTFTLWTLTVWAVALAGYRAVSGRWRRPRTTVDPAP